ncbi:MAG TPA: site-2 protease family protein [Bacillota bacterium]|nr:site-2 protease family protein [Bacillota bacterium]
MKSSFRLGRIFGIAIDIHFSWLLVLALFSMSLARGYFPEVLPDLPPRTYWLTAVLTTIIAFASILAHELAHSLMAIRQGISIKKIVLFIFGGVAQMETEAKQPLAELKITVVGPLTSFCIGIILGLIYYLVLPPGNIISEALFFVAYLNIYVSLFNLIPAFPLDGGRILRAIIWYFSKNLLRATRAAVGLGSLISFLGIGYGFLTIIIRGNIMGLWLVFLGWMIYQAGQTSYSQLVFQETFGGIRVEKIMSPNPVTVSPDLNLQQLADNFLEHKFGAFPVVYGSTTHGLVSLHQMKDIPRDKWIHTPVTRIMTPLKDCTVASPQEDAASIMMKMAASNEGRVLVMDNGDLVGILSRTDMMRFMQMHLVLGSE